MSMKMQCVCVCVVQIYTWYGFCFSVVIEGCKLLWHCPRYPCAPWMIHARTQHGRCLLEFTDSLLNGNRDRECLMCYLDSDHVILNLFTFIRLLFLILTPLPKMPTRIQPRTTANIRLRDGRYLPHLCARVCMFHSRTYMSMGRRVLFFALGNRILVFITNLIPLVLLQPQS